MNAPALITIASLGPVGALQADPTAGLLTITDPAGNITRFDGSVRTLREMAARLTQAADERERLQWARATLAAKARACTEDALSAAYQADTLKDARAILAERLTKLIDADGEAAAEAVAEVLTARALRGMGYEYQEGEASGAFIEACADLDSPEPVAVDLSLAPWRIAAAMEAQK